MRNQGRINVNYIIWERDDAIGKATSKIIKNIKDNRNINFNLTILKTDIKNRFLRYLAHIKNLVNLFRLVISGSVIHFEEPKNIESNIILFFRNKRSILTVNHLDKEKDNIFNNLFYLIQKRKYSSFTKLIAISDNTKRDLIKRYSITPSKIFVIPLGVDKEIFKPTNRKESYFRTKKYILYLGSEIPRKNTENLFKAFKLLLSKYPPLVLIKAGYSGGDKYRKNTKRLINELGLKDSVILVSKKLKEKELPSYYSNAELFVYPTLKEGFGMPLVEAMACGCPVVTSNLAPMNEIAKGQTLVNPYDYKDIAKGMDKILSNKKNKEQLKKKAILRAKDFDWEKTAKKVLEVYEELAKNDKSVYSTKRKGTKEGNS